MLDFNGAPPQWPEIPPAPTGRIRIADLPADLTLPIARVLNCQHQRLSRPRAKIVNGGQTQYRLQCLDCGKAIGGAIAKQIALLQNDGLIAEPFDEGLREIGDAAWNDEVRKKVEQQERERATRAEWYYEYMRSEAWRKKRQKVLERCGGLCEGCRIRSVDQVHHLTYAHVGRELLYELVALCRQCHETAHGVEVPA